MSNVAGIIEKLERIICSGAVDELGRDGELAISDAIEALRELRAQRDEARAIACRWMVQAGQSDWVAGHVRDEWERDCKTLGVKP